MISKKICLLGAFSVGKTSLVERYVNSIFSDSYISTVGVKISKKQMCIGNTELTMILWDLEGKDDFMDVNITYLKGTMGFFVVADLSRKETLEVALKIRKIALELLGDDTPNILLLNKADLEEYEISEQQISDAREAGIELMLTSAKDGICVEEAFDALAQKMIGGAS